MDFRQFLIQSFPTLEQSPAARFNDDWYFAVIGEHAEAFLAGQIPRLVVTQPPGTYKSRAWVVALIAFDWLEHPERKYLVATNEKELGIEHSRNTRRLIESSWYGGFRPAYNLRGDNNAVMLFANTAGGHRQTTSVDSKVSGKKGDILLVDDIHDATKVHKAVVRNSDKQWFNHSFWDRQKDFTSTPIGVIGHRLHRNDLPSDLIYNGWCHLNLPERFEERLRKTFPLGGTDPRAEGEYLRPDRFGPAQEAEVKRQSGELVWAAKHQGDPKTAEGSDFPLDKFAGTMSAIPYGTECVRYWDTAASTSEAAHYTAGALLGRTPDGRFLIVNMRRAKLTPTDRNNLIESVAYMDARTPNVTMRGVFVEQEPGGTGLEAVQTLIRKLAGYNARADKVTGDKRTRAQPLSAQWCAGNVWMLEDEPHDRWNLPLLERLEAAHTLADSDDRDACSGAFNMLTLRTPSGQPVGPGAAPVDRMAAGTFRDAAGVDVRTEKF